MTDTEHYEFISTNLESADYDTQTGDLSVTFARTGDSYAFPAVPMTVWQGLKAAVSPGRFFATEIKGKY